MKIGIIGAGNIGGALAHRFGAAGHEVTIANSRGPDSLADLATQTGARAGTVEEAVRGNDVVVVAIPLHRISDLPADLFADAPSDLIVVDTSNYYPQQRDGRIDAIEAGMTESGWVERHLKRPVVKAFNSIIAPHLLENGKPKGAADRIALAVAGDDPTAKRTVVGLIGARQSARSTHFICAAGLAGFIVLHVVLIVPAGPTNEIRSMITGSMHVGRLYGMRIEAVQTLGAVGGGRVGYGGLERLCLVRRRLGRPDR